MTVKTLTIRDAGNDVAEVCLYGIIGDDFFSEGLDAKTFRAQLKAVKARTLNLRIHSPGGSVFEADAMVAALDEYRKRGRVEVDIDGLAGSCASYIACCGDVVRISANGKFMIHNPYAGVMGDAAELRRKADLLDATKGQIIATYQRRNKVLSKEQLAAAMDAETWYLGNEAKTAGWVDSVGGPTQVAALAIPAELWAKMGYRQMPPVGKGEVEADAAAWAETNRRREIAAKLVGT